MHLDTALEHVKKLLAGMTHQLAEFLQRSGAHARHQRNHALLAQLGAQKEIFIVARVHVNGTLQGPHAAPGHRPAFRLLATGREQLRHPHFQPLADLLQLVIAERETVVLDFRERRARNAGSVAHLLECPVVTRAQSLHQRA